MAYKDEMMVNLKATELRLGLPGTHETHYSDESSSTGNTTPNTRKRQSDKLADHVVQSQQDEEIVPPPAKSQIVGWPPVRSYRKNSLMMSQQKKSSNNNNNNNSEAENICGTFVKVSMDGAPYLRKIDLRVYNNYLELLKALEAMFNFTIGAYSEREGYKGSDFVPTYEDKDGDWMLVGDVPWNMFMSSCKRMRVMKESEARGLGCGV